MNKIRIAAIMVLSALLVVCAIVFAVSYGRDTTDKNINDIPSTPPPPELDVNVSSSPDGVELPVLSKLSRVKQGWGPGTEVNDKNQPTGAIMAQNQYSELGGQFIFPDDDSVMYLTFDLGYENGYTEAILDALDARGVKGTFFITMDYVKEAPHIVKRIIDGGHTLANHTVKHPSIPDVSDARMTSEIMDLHNYIQDTYGYTMTLFRYPMGEFSEYTLKFIDNLGYKSIFWSFAYVDWKTNSQPGHAEALKKVTNSMHNGAVYLLHAVSATNAAIMGDFVDTAMSQGYCFGLVDQRLGLVAKEPSLLP